ncbi:MAG: Carbohydrate binding protein, partial [Gammaproteobacteria bacterium]|nr:Carbohydrate binding protein [Gammaproteobacteria bacterium]
MNLSMLTRRNNVRVMVSLCMLGAGSAFAASAWQPDVYYTAGTQVSYNGATYSALVNQT